MEFVDWLSTMTCEQSLIQTGGLLLISLSINAAFALYCFGVCQRPSGKTSRMAVVAKDVIDVSPEVIEYNKIYPIIGHGIAQPARNETPGRWMRMIPSPRSVRFLFTPVLPHSSGTSTIWMVTSHSKKPKLIYISGL